MNTRSQAQVKQYNLFQCLGTYARGKYILQSVARPSHYSPFNEVKITPLEQRILDAAAYVLSDISKRALADMRTLPSKKNLAKQKV